MAALVFVWVKGKLSLLSDPLLNGLLLYSSIIIKAGQKKNLEKAPIKCCINKSLNPALQQRPYELLNAAVVWFSLFLSAHMHISSWNLHGLLCAAVLTFMWAAVGCRWFTIYNITPGENQIKKKDLES